MTWISKAWRARKAAEARALEEAIARHPATLAKYLNVVSIDTCLTGKS